MQKLYNDDRFPICRLPNREAAGATLSFWI